MKGDYESMKRKLELFDWEREMDGKSVDRMWSCFKSKIHAVKDKYIKEKKSNRPSPKPPWMRKAIESSVKKMYWLWKRVEQTGRNREYKEYKAQVKEHNKKRKDMKKNEKNIVKKFKDKPKMFYSYMRSNLKVKAIVPQLVKPNAEYTESDEEVAGVLSNFFKSVFTEEGDGLLLEFRERVSENENLKDIEITEESGYKRLMKLKVDKACGPDELHPKLLKQCAVQIRKPLLILFKETLVVGYVPKDRKLTNVVALHKKGSRSKVDNYQPVSLTSQFVRSWSHWYMTIN